MAINLRPIPNLSGYELKLPPTKSGRAGWYSWRFDESVEFAPPRYLSDKPTWKPTRKDFAAMSPPPCILGPYFTKRDLLKAMHSTLLHEIVDLRKLGHDNKAEIEAYRRKLNDSQQYGLRQDRIRRELHRLADDLRAALRFDSWLCRLLRSERTNEANTKLMQFDMSKVQ